MSVAQPQKVHAPSPFGFGAAAFTRCASEDVSRGRVLACRAVARGGSRGPPSLRFGAAAFTRFASEGWWAVQGSNL
jgi:hypothetical protein